MLTCLCSFALQVHVQTQIWVEHSHNFGLDKVWLHLKNNPDAGAQLEAYLTDMLSSSVLNGHLSINTLQVKAFSCLACQTSGSGSD